MIKKYFHIIFCALITAPTIFYFSVSKADGLIVIEPYVGVAAGRGEHDLKFYTTDPLQLDTDYMHAFGGLRLTYYSYGLWYGLDVNAYPAQEIRSKNNKTGTWQWDSQDIATEKFDAARYNAGVILGYRGRWMIWGAYYPYALLYADSSSKTNLVHKGDTWDGEAYGGGLGFMLYPNFWISGEYRHYTYDVDSVQSTDSATGADQEFDLGEGMIVFSFPLEF